MFLKITAKAGIIIFLNFCRLCIDFPEKNRPFFIAVACYHLATAREMASHLSVHSHHKALSAIAERLPREFKGKAALKRRLRLFFFQQLFLFSFLFNIFIPCIFLF